MADFVMLLVCEVKSAKELHDRHLGKRLALHFGALGEVRAHGLPSFPKIIPFGSFLGGSPKPTDAEAWPS